MSSCQHNCMSCLFKEHSLLQGLSMKELALLESRRNSVKYKKGEVIYKEGMPVNELLCLNTGKVKIVKKIDNQDKLIELKKPVDFIGFEALMCDITFQDTAVAIEDSGICSIHRDDLMEVINKNSAFALKVIRHQSRALTLTKEKMLVLTGKNMKPRLCDVLLNLDAMYGSKPDGTLNVCLKRHEIAELSNMTTSNVIKTLSLLQKEGLIELHGKSIRIPDREKLRNEIVSI